MAPLRPDMDAKPGSILADTSQFTTLQTRFSLGHGECGRDNLYGMKNKRPGMTRPLTVIQLCCQYIRGQRSEGRYYAARRLSAELLPDLRSWTMS